MENLIRNVQNMHTMKKILVILLASCLLPLAAGAQDARQRTATTIVADALAQLPAQTSEVYNGLMRELASTGAAASGRWPACSCPPTRDRTPSWSTP